MPALTFTPNDEPAAGTNRGGFGFVFLTTKLPLREDSQDGLYDGTSVRIKPH